MKLLDSFCHVKSFTVDDVAIHAELTFPEDHPVYGGHFPGRPVVPGACMLQIIKELTERGLGNAVSMREVGNMKFPAALLPSGTEAVTFLIDHHASDGGWKANATVRSGDRLNASFKELIFDKA